jgi:hypothetical protein
MGCGRVAKGLLEQFSPALTHMFVMAGLVPAIHVLAAAKTWMPGTSPGMTNLYAVQILRFRQVENALSP